MLDATKKPKNNKSLPLASRQKANDFSKFLAMSPLIAICAIANFIVPAPFLVVKNDFSFLIDTN